jgi:predicted metal-dependent phosphotriesterase family hydrolase
MSEAPATGRAQTVLGPVDPAELGRVLPHEHSAIAAGVSEEEIRTMTVDNPRRLLTIA